MYGGLVYYLYWSTSQVFINYLKNDKIDSLGPDEIREAKLEANSNVLQSNKAISPQYKTVLCNLNDECKFGQANCNFAHSESELRTVQQNLAEINPNYKGNKIS